MRKSKPPKAEAVARIVDDSIHMAIPTIRKMRENPDEKKRLLEMHEAKSRRELAIAVSDLDRRQIEYALGDKQKRDFRRSMGASSLDPRQSVSKESVQLSDRTHFQTPEQYMSDQMLQAIRNRAVEPIRMRQMAREVALYADTFYIVMDAFDKLATHSGDFRTKEHLKILVDAAGNHLDERIGTEDRVRAINAALEGIQRDLQIGSFAVHSVVPHSSPTDVHRN